MRVPATPSTLAPAIPTSVRPAIARPGHAAGSAGWRPMTMNAPGPIAALFAATLAAAALAAPALAQTTVTRTETTAPGKAVRLLIAPNLKKDCSNGPMPEIKVASAPKNGSIITKTGKLKTPSGYRCPNKEAEAQAVFYQSKPGFSGTDQVLVEIKTSEGSVQRQDIRITVDAAKKDEKKDDSNEKKGVTDL